MLKFKEVAVTFSEVPEEVTLCINITGCPIHCKGCHSKHLWEDIGEELKPVVLSNLIAKNLGVTCIAFMGGDADVDAVVKLAKWVKDNTELKTCWYSGQKLLTDVELHFQQFDYVKIGPYIEELGGLDNPTTNQKFYKVVQKKENGIIYPSFEDITFKFRNNEANNKSKSAD